MKKTSFLLAGILVAGILIRVFFPSSHTPISSEQEVLSMTNTLSKDYLRLRLDTEQLLVDANTYEYPQRNNQVTDLIAQWQSFEEKTTELEHLATQRSTQSVANQSSTVQAYSTQEISDVFDKAPAGKKIATLAKFLGVDAKRAFKILQNDQEMVKADARNEAGDTFQKLETSAVVIKDGCKVAGFVGGVIITGGASGFAAVGVVTKTAVVVAGADLVLEVTEDGANIALGNHNKVTEIAGDIRKITEPAAAILAISDLPENVVKNIDKLNIVVFGADQFRSTLQDGKIIGIKLPAYEKDKVDKPIEAVIMDEEEIDSRLGDNGYERDDGSAEELLKEDEMDDNDEIDDDMNGNDEDVDDKEASNTDFDLGDIDTSKSLNGTYNGILAGDNLEGLVIPATISVNNGKVDGNIDYSMVLNWGDTEIPFTLHIDIYGIVTKDERLQTKMDGTVVIGGEKANTVSIWGTISGSFTKVGGIVDIRGEFRSEETEHIDTMDPMYIVFTRE